MAGLKSRLASLAHPLTATLARARVHSPRPPRFAGAYPTRAAALAALPDTARSGYDTPDVAEVAFDEMCRVVAWDYPVLFWLQQTLRPGMRVLDAGGHMGTKYIAFRDLLPLEEVTWTVFDLPAITAAGRAAQGTGRVPQAIRFADTLDTAGPVDLFLASGLFQYADQTLPQMLARLPAPPETLLLNKVATTDGAARVTLEQIGGMRVPYAIHQRAAFEAAFATAGYTLIDSWVLPNLSHRIPTHPWLGESVSRGYMLRRAEGHRTD